jgi:hypothetical protein
VIVESEHFFNWAKNGQCDEPKKDNEEEEDGPHQSQVAASEM